MRVVCRQLAYDDEAAPEQRRTAVAAQVARLGRDADLVVLPELWSAGAFAPKGWAERAQPRDGAEGRALAGAARQAGCVVHGGSLVERDGEELHNTAVLWGPDGRELAAYRKIHTFGAAGLERELMTPGVEPCLLDLPLRAGDSVRVGLATCYDLRFPELFRALVDGGAQVFVVAASWPAVRADAWRLLLRARAVENQAYVVACAAAGVNGRTAMAGGSCVIGPDGQVRAAAPSAADVPGGDRLGAPQAELSATLDLAEIGRERAAFPVLPDRRLHRC